MRKKPISIIFVVIFITLMSSSVFAAPMPPMPECKIKAEVIDVNVKHSPSHESAKDMLTYQRQTSGWTVIKILEVDEKPVVNSPYVDSDEYCKRYTKGTEITLNLAEDYKKGTIFEGELAVRGDEANIWYSLSNIKNIQNHNIIDDNQEEIINSDKQQNSNIFYIFAISTVVTILLIILWFFLIRRR